MRLLLPVDSRLADTQGLLALDEKGGLIAHVITEEKHAYARRGFRGACVAGDRLYVCNSFSLKIYRIVCGDGDTLEFRLLRQVLRPEWLIGRGANADLHYPFHDAVNGRILLANSYMDCIDSFSLDGDFIGRKFLWEISAPIDELVRKRDPRAADLCHVNYIERVGDELLLTLGNLNGSGNGAVMSYDSGEMFLQDLARPHDGVLFRDEYFMTETSRHRVLFYSGIACARDLCRREPRIIDLAGTETEATDNRFWLRGLLVTEDHLYVGCSQFQDRDSGTLGVVPSHVVVVDKRTLQVVDRLLLPSIAGLDKPVIYSFFNLDRVIAGVRAAA